MKTMSIEEKIAITANLTYTAVIDGKDWQEVTETFEEAVALLRDLVEADHHHVFQTVTSWRACSTGRNASISCQAKWVDTLNGKTFTRTIRVNGLTNKDIDDRWDREKALYENWDKVCAPLRAMMKKI